MKHLSLLLLFSTALFAGSNTLIEVTDGRVQTNHVNQFSTALKQDLMPRNSSGVVTDAAGDLGSSTQRWDDVYVRRLHFGSVGSMTTIEGTGINGSLLVAGSVARSKLESLGLQLSSGTGAGLTGFTNSYSDVSGTTITLTTVGRPVRLFLQPTAGVGAASSIDITDSGTGGQGVELRIARDGSDIYTTKLGLSTSTVDMYYSPGVISFLDTTATAGSHTYKLQAKLQTSSGTALTFNYVTLGGYEK